MHALMCCWAGAARVCQPIAPLTTWSTVALVFMHDRNFSNCGCGSGRPVVRQRQQQRDQLVGVVQTGTHHTCHVASHSTAALQFSSRCAALNQEDARACICQLLMTADH